MISHCRNDVAYIAIGIYICDCMLNYVFENTNTRRNKCASWDNLFSCKMLMIMKVLKKEYPKAKHLILYSLSKNCKYGYSLIYIPMECSEDRLEILLPALPDGLVTSTSEGFRVSSINWTSFQSTLIASICSTRSFLSRSKACLAEASSLVKCLMCSSCLRPRTSSFS